MKIHLVGGFLGSGKTTAISNSCKVLLNRGINASVITNDQGNYLVDSFFISQAEIATGEVTGGCFCCNYDELDTQIHTLKADVNPDVIFAETVGSCTDLVATVLKPLLLYRDSDIEEVTFSSFTDARLLLMHLRKQELPFAYETSYIWEKQIEEAEILVINKTDLLSPEESVAIKKLAREAYPAKNLLFQNSLSHASVSDWIEVISQPSATKSHKSVDIDYDIYGAGEANLAWLDEEIEFRTDNHSALQVASSFIDSLTTRVAANNYTIGHLKFLLSYGSTSHKISFTTLAEKKKQVVDTSEKVGTVHLIVNARIQSTPEQLRQLVVDELTQLESLGSLQILEKCVSCFSPGFPKPLHRVA
jgi:G3E family GTPase